MSRTPPADCCDRHLAALAGALRETAAGADLDEFLAFAGAGDVRSILLGVARLAEVAAGATAKGDPDWRLLADLATERVAADERVFTAVGAAVAEIRTMQATTAAARELMAAWEARAIARAVR